MPEITYKMCAKICHLLLAPTGPGFGVPPAGPAFGGYPQPPVQSYGGGGPAQIPGTWVFPCHMLRYFKQPKLNQESPSQVATK